MNVAVDIVIEQNQVNIVNIQKDQGGNENIPNRIRSVGSKSQEYANRSLSYTLFECPICSDILEDVVESPCCHKCFCSGCINSWLLVSKECPFCRKLINSVADCKPCVPIQQIVNNLVVDCPNVNAGCEDSVTKGIAKEHQTKCLFATVGCTNSKSCEPMYRKDLDDHILNHCQHREVACSLCNVKVQFYKLEEHRAKDCQEMEVSCDLQCGATVLRKALHEHRNAKCPESYHYCKYYRVGCLQQIKRKEFADHCQKNLQQHLDLTEKAFEAKEEEHHSLSNEFKTFEENANTMNHKFQDQLKMRDERIAHQEKEIESLKSLVQRQTRDLTAQHIDLEALRKRLNSPTPPPHAYVNMKAPNQQTGFHYPNEQNPSNNQRLYTLNQQFFKK